MSNDKFTKDEILDDEHNHQHYYHSETGQVKCMECGKYFNRLSGQHVANHGLTWKGYQEKYPDAPLKSLTIALRKVECLVCHEMVEKITHTHLKSHNTTPEEYKELMLKLNPPDQSVLVEECFECHKKFKKLTYKHLKKDHDMTWSEYVTKHADKLPKKEITDPVELAKMSIRNKIQKQLDKPINERDYKEILKDIIALPMCEDDSFSYHSNYTRHHPEIKDWLIETTKKYNISDLTTAEMVYITITGILPNICKNGKRQQLQSVFVGWRSYCEMGTDCLCKKEKRQQKRDEDRATILKARHDAFVARGCVHTSALQSTKDKMIATNMEKYGTPYVMHIARAAYTEQYGCNPFANPEVKEQIKRTLMEKYGVDHPTKSPEIIKKRETTTMARYGRRHHAQKHISTESLRILENKELLIEALNTATLIGLARRLGTSDSTIGRHMKRHGMELKGRSSYENYMRNFLKNLEIDFIQNTRSIISNELDFYIPSLDLAIELHGLYYHTDDLKASDYHLKKWKECRDKGITLISLFSDEMDYRQELVEICIRKCLGIYDIEDVDYNIKEYSDKDRVEWFFNEYSLNDFEGEYTKCIAAFDEQNNPIAMMIFNDNVIVDYVTMCSIKDIRNLLFDYYHNIVKHTNYFVITDNRFDDSYYYEQIGFTLAESIPEQAIITDYHSRGSKAKKDKGFVWDCGRSFYKFDTTI